MGICDEKHISVYQACGTWSQEHHPAQVWEQRELSSRRKHNDESPLASASCERFLRVVRDFPPKQG
jgi:hypothetical protein